MVGGEREREYSRGKMPSKGVECTERLFFSPKSWQLPEDFLREDKEPTAVSSFSSWRRKENGYFNNGPDLYNSRSRRLMYNTHFSSTPDNPLDKASRPKAVQEAKCTRECNSWIIM